MKKSLFSVIFLTLLAMASVATAQIQMTFSVVQPTCHGYFNGSATVFAVGGTGAYTYAWSTNQTTQTTFGIGAGTYTVTVTDAAQSTASGEITVVEPSAVTAAITASNLSCDGKSGTLTAAGFGGTPPYTYAWNGPGGTSSLESVAVMNPGNYFLTVTDANNCSGVGSFTVATALTLDVVATDIPCAIYPNGGSANAIAMGGVTPYTYNWSSGGNTALVTDLGAGPHICTVTSANGCVAIDSDYVDIPSALVVETIWLTPACGGNNNGTAIVEASGGTPPYTYTWTPGGLTGPSQTGLAPGQYYVCTFDSNHCQKDLWVIIPATNGLDVQLVVKSATCVGIDNATATAVVSPAGSGYVYEWTIISPDSVVTHITGVAQLTNLAAGSIVSVTVTDPVSGCSGTASGTVGAHTNINLTVTDVDILCSGGFGSATAVASNGTPQYTITWFDGNHVQIGNPSIGDSSSIFDLGPGAYLVSVVDSLGCEAQGVADIGIQSAPDAIIDGGHVLVCGDSLSTVQFINASVDPYNLITSLVWTVTGPHIDTVIVQQNQITFQLPVDDTITVQLIATSGLGCADTATLVYNVPGYPNLTLSLDSTTINCIGNPFQIDVINGDSSYAYVWNPAVVLNPNPLHVLVNPTVTTTYVLTATDGNACTAADSITIAPFDSIFHLTVTDSLIQSCADSVTLFASANLPATIVWSQGNIILIGNPVTVPATPIPTIYTASAYTADSCLLTEQVSVTGYGIQVSIDSTADLTICEGDSLTLGVNVTPPSDSLTYQWSVNAPATLLNPTTAHPILFGPAGTYTVTVIVTNIACSDTLSFQVEIIPGFDLDGHLSVDLCDGLDVSFFNDSGIGGEWNFGDGSPLDTTVNPIHTYSHAGTYPVVFSPNVQCTAPWDTMIEVHTFALQASINHVYLECADTAQIQFSGSTNLPDSITVSWSWTFSAGTPATSILQNPTVFFTQEDTIKATLIVRDNNGCLDTVTSLVVVHIIHDTIPNTVMICLGDSVQLNPGGHDLGSGYHWTSVPIDSTLNPTDPNPTVTPLVPTVYSVEITEGLCLELYTVTVNFYPGSMVYLPNDTIVCTDDSLSITAQGNGTTGYEWSNSIHFTNIFAHTQTVQVLPHGTYYVRTTGFCVAMDSIHIEQKIPEIQVLPTDTAICLGEETALMLTNLLPDQTLHYTWNPPLTDVPNPIVSPTETTTYAVTVTNEFGCTATLVFPTVTVTNVSVNAEALPDSVSFAHPTTILLATPGGNGTVVTYQWTPPETLSSPNSPQTEATPTETQIYTVTVTTDNGCIATDTVTVRLRQSACIAPFVFIPKAFTPNHDEKNDHFIVRANGMTALKFIVWNRWGEIVYETNDPSDQGWDGTYKGKDVTPDAFAWYVWLVCGNGEVFESKGNVTLLK